MQALACGRLKTHLCPLLAAKNAVMQRAKTLQKARRLVKTVAGQDSDRSFRLEGLAGLANLCDGLVDIFHQGQAVVLGRGNKLAQFLQKGAHNRLPLRPNQN